MVVTTFPEKIQENNLEKPRIALWLKHQNYAM